MTENTVLDAVADGVEPYTPMEIADFQTEADKWTTQTVQMNPYRVQASVEAAAIRGMEYQREYDAEDRKREHQTLVISIWSGVIVAVMLMFLVSTISYENSNPLTPAEHIEGSGNVQRSLHKG